MDSRIFLAVVMESVITMILWMLSLSMVGIRPVQMVMSSASIDITFIEWICNHWIIELSNQIWAAAVATCDFLTPPSAIIAMLLEDVWEALKVRLRFHR